MGEAGFCVGYNLYDFSGNFVDCVRYSDKMKLLCFQNYDTLYKKGWFVWEQSKILGYI